MCEGETKGGTHPRDQEGAFVMSSFVAAIDPTRAWKSICFILVVLDEDLPGSCGGRGLSDGHG